MQAMTVSRVPLFLGMSVLHNLPLCTYVLVSDRTNGSRPLRAEISNVSAHAVRVYEL